MKKWLRLLFFIPIIVVFILTNYLVDPGEIFHDGAKSMAKAMLEGKNVYYTSGNGNERALKRFFAEGMPNNVDTISVGPSLSMQIGKDVTGINDLYCLGVSRSDFYDDFAIFGILNKFEKNFDHVILCHDVGLFVEEEFTSRHDTYKPIAMNMIDIVNGKVPEDVKIEILDNTYSTSEPLFSVAYFQRALKYIVLVGLKAALSPQKWGIVTEGFTGGYYLPDGSIIYDKKSNEITGDEVRKTAENNELIKNVIAKPYYKMEYEKLIKYLTEKGIKVTLFLSPYAPALWDIIEADKENYKVYDEIEKFAYDLQEKYGVKITGSFNPYNVGMTNDDFMDLRHIKKDSLRKYFDFKLE